MWKYQFDGYKAMLGRQEWPQGVEDVLERIKAALDFKRITPGEFERLQNEAARILQWINA